MPDSEKTIRFGRKVRFHRAWVWDDTTETFIKSMVLEHPILNVCAGASTFGDIRLDKFKGDRFYPIQIKGDATRLPFKDDSFAAVFTDPPWSQSFISQFAMLCREALRVAPVLYTYSPTMWGTKDARITSVWARQATGCVHPVLLVRYERANGHAIKDHDQAEVESFALDSESNALEGQS